MNKKRHRRKKTILTLAKIHGYVTIFVTAFYLSFGFWFGPSALWDDFSQKYEKVKAAVVTVTAHVAGPPGEPIISTTVDCSNYTPRISLLWGTTEDTNYYTVYRNGQVLSPVLDTTVYHDTQVTSGTTYSYIVSATGPRGETMSDEVYATAQTCPSPPIDPGPNPPTEPEPSPRPWPEIVTVYLSNIDLNRHIKLPSTKSKKPRISVVTNMPYAVAKLDIVVKPRKIATILANDNGYFTWKSKKNLKYKRYTVYITVYDPQDLSRSTLYSFQFKVVRKKTKIRLRSVSTAVSGTHLYLKRSSFVSAQKFKNDSFTFNNLLSSNNPSDQKNFYQGENITGHLKTNDAAKFKEEYTITYRLLNRDQKQVAELGRQKVVKGEENQIPFSFKIPYTVKEGEYLLEANLDGNSFEISKQTSLKVKETPLITLSQTVALTCHDVINNVGWIALGLSGVSLFILLLLLFEYSLTNKARIEISEYQLKQKRLIS